MLKVWVTDIATSPVPSTAAEATTEFAGGIGDALGAGDRGSGRRGGVRVRGSCIGCASDRGSDRGCGSGRGRSIEHLGT